MKQLDAQLKKLAGLKGHGYWADRIISQLQYFRDVAFWKKEELSPEFVQGVAFVAEKAKSEGTVTRETALACEQRLAHLSGKAKENTLYCAAHAHIDMNWMWRFDETVSVVLDTLRTMLSLLAEFPEYKFSQSQASVYRIVEEYEPAMIEEIKKYVKEGRWEVSASTWVEADKNMPSGESHARHLLYTKQYLAKLLDIAPESILLDFEPDTFGHSQNVPEVLSKGGVPYYYHSRGRTGYALYRWQAPSGAEVTAFCDPCYYGGDISSGIVSFHMPRFLQETGHNACLFVYGVGDHGGGPSRRDIRRILDMNGWPLFPRVQCATYGEFFKSTEAIKESLPLLTEEGNFVFTGCYSSQTRIKAANRISEAELFEAEQFSAVSALQGGSGYPAEKFAEGWKKTLFNQFHDILTGSGTQDTREHAMGEFQNTMAIATTEKTAALRRIAANIDLAAYEAADDAAKDTASAGAGVGSRVGEFRVSQVSRGSGLTRAFVVFNPSLEEREENVEIEVWNWEGEIPRARFADVQGKPVAHQLVHGSMQTSWGYQQFFRVMIRARVPACGYATYILTENADYISPANFPDAGRVDAPQDYVLENEKIRVQFHPVTAAIVSFIDKETGEEHADAKRPTGIFRYIEENTTQGMTSWRVGPYMNITDITSNVVIRELNSGAHLLRQSFEYEAQFENSKINVHVFLHKDSAALAFEVSCDWHEFGKQNVKIPQLAFYMPLAYPCDAYTYDVPFGVANRAPARDDRPGLSFVAAPKQGGKTLFLNALAKYSFRGYENALGLTLIRSSYDPDVYPEIGNHKIRFWAGLTAAESNSALLAEMNQFSHPLSPISVKPGKGSMPASQGFMKLGAGTGVVSAVKMAEDGKSLIVRLYEANGQEGIQEISFFKEVAAARQADLHETQQEEVSFAGNTVAAKLPPYGVVTLAVRFQ